MRNYKQDSGNWLCSVIFSWHNIRAILFSFVRVHMAFILILCCSLTVTVFQSASWSPLFYFRALLEVPVTIVDHVISLGMPFPQNWILTCCLECFSHKISKFSEPKDRYLPCHIYTAVTVCTALFHCPCVNLCSGMKNQLPRYCVICCWSESIWTSWPFHAIGIC